MYTGIIEAVGTLALIEKRGNGAFVKVMTPASFKVKDRVKIGDSVASNGVCLTATTIGDDFFTADVSAETVAMTCFKFYKQGQRLNLELPCTPATHLGGHIVQGHVDGIGEIKDITPLGEAVNIWVKNPPELSRYIALKGSIAVDGASLTVNSVTDDSFRLTLIPHSQMVLAFENWKSGSKVNLEVDVLARYLERLILGQKAQSNAEEKNSALSFETLMQNGFI